jgi:hypothetical protein
MAQIFITGSEWPLKPLNEVSRQEDVSKALGMVHAWVGQKLVKSNIFASFI